MYTETAKTLKFPDAPEHGSNEEIAMKAPTSSMNTM